MTTVVITMNLPSDDTPNVHCTPATARQGLADTIARHHPDWMGLQEFGIKPEADGYHFTRAHPCVGAKKATGDRFTEHRVFLTKGRKVEPEAGRRLVLPAVYATELVKIPETGSIELCSNTHLPAHVEIRGLYRKIKDHLTGRSAMHRQARRTWRKKTHHRVRELRRQHPDREVRCYLTADPNFSLMKLRGFVSCWEKHHLRPTFGPRTIDTVWSLVKALAVTTFKIPSDHHGVKATYP